MNNEIINTGKPAQQSGEQEPEDKASMPTTQDNATLIRRRNLLKGLGAAPLVMTLHSGAAMAAQSNMACRGDGLTLTEIERTGIGCVDEATNDSYLRTKVGVDGKVDGWSANVKHPYYSDDDKKNGENLCLLSVDQNGVIDVDEVHSDGVVTTSCWCSFT